MTTQVPALVVESNPLEIAQPLAVPLTTLKLTAPVPEPPEVVRVSAVSAVPLIEVTLRVAWAASEKVTTVNEELTGL